MVLTLTPAESRSETDLYSRDCSTDRSSSPSRLDNQQQESNLKKTSGTPDPDSTLAADTMLCRKRCQLMSLDHALLPEGALKTGQHRGL